MHQLEPFVVKVLVINLNGVWYRVAISQVETKMPKHKDSYTLGLEKVLNNPETSFLRNPQVFNEIQKTSLAGMSISSMMKHLGKKSREQKQTCPTDDELSKQRLAKLEK